MERRTGPQTSAAPNPLRLARILAGASLQNLAHRAGISLSHLSRLERNQRRLSPELYSRLLRALSDHSEARR